MFAVVAGLECEFLRLDGGVELLLAAKERDFSYIYIYIYYIHPELRISNYRSGTGKGAGPL